MFPGSVARPLLVVLCRDAIQYGWTAVYAEGGGVIEFVLKPVGPFKLARALGLCLERRSKATEKAGTESRTSKAIAASDAPAARSCMAIDSNATVELNDKSSPSGIGGFRQGTSEPLTDLVMRPSDASTVSSLHNTAKTSNIPKILIVDDNKINLRLLEAFLKKCGYHVDSAEDGSLAVKAVENSKGYDIIFMGMSIHQNYAVDITTNKYGDISMPVLDGFEATRAIRKLEKGHREKRYIDSGRPLAYIIALTALVSGQDQSKAFACGVNSYLTKPVPFRKIGKLVDVWQDAGIDALMKGSMRH
jgi:CheY-like chemotaxis protein